MMTVMPNQRAFEDEVRQAFTGARVLRVVTIRLPLGIKHYAAVLEDEHGRFAVGREERTDGLTRIGEAYIRQAIAMYDDAIEECERFLKDLRETSDPVAPLSHGNF